MTYLCYPAGMPTKSARLELSVHGLGHGVSVQRRAEHPDKR